MAIHPFMEALLCLPDILLLAPAAVNNVNDVELLQVAATVMSWEKPVAAHFCQQDHTLDDLKAIVVDKALAADTVLRKNRESRWIRLLQTETPKGMNLRVDRF